MKTVSLLSLCIMFLTSCASQSRVAQTEQRKVAGLATANEQIADALARSGLGDAIGELRYQLDDGILLLQGSISTLAAHRRLLEVCRAALNVEAIVDRTVVRPGLRDEVELVAAIEDRVLREPALSSEDIAIGVRGGEVTLLGSVTSTQRQELAWRVAAAESGVLRVINQLEVKRQTWRADQAIRRDVIGVLNADPRIDASGLIVDVRGALVTISGRVGSYLAKQHIYRQVWVDNVGGVRFYRLQYDGRFSRPMLRKALPVNRPPARIVQNIRRALALVPELYGKFPQLQLRDKTLTLSGELVSLAARRAVNRVAGDTPGVAKVNDQTTLRPVAQASGDKVRRQAVAILDKDPLISRYSLGLRWSAQTPHLLTLVGTLPSAFDRQLLRRRLEGIFGVTRIDLEQVVISRQAQRFYSDSEAERILRRALARLNANERVDVAVKNGVAALNGHVRRFDERLALEQRALEVGAWRVNNQLRVPEPHDG
ncbi:MAG: BON domain-containing protein [Deltaproteobacteria bacterium]|nr:BON domain-containing protein [Deltaproteobacteria bacterium]